MKCMHLILIIMASLAVLPAHARYLVTNGGFDTDAGNWQFDGIGIGYHTIDSGNGYVILIVDPGNWSVWHQIVNDRLDDLGISPGQTITMTADIKSLAGYANFTSAALKIEAWTETALIGQREVVFNVTNQWATYSLEYAVPANATRLRCVLVNVVGAAASTAGYAYDNVKIFPPGAAGTPARNPNPAVGARQFPADSVLSWSNPDPNNPGDVITADVFILESDVFLPADPNLGPIFFDPGVVQAANDTAAEWVDLSAVSYTLQDDKYYYWAVHVTDPNIGLIEGSIWHFHTFNAPPVAAITTNLASRLFLNDGLSFVLTASAEDPDNHPGPMTYAWAKVSGPGSVSFSNPSGLSTRVTISAVGAYELSFTASDGKDIAVDTISFIVEPSADDYLLLHVPFDTDPNDVAANKVGTLMRNTLPTSGGSEPVSEYGWNQLDSIQPGIVNNAISTRSMAGGGQWMVEFDNQPDLLNDLGNEFTIMMWIKTDATPNAMAYLFTKHQNLRIKRRNGQNWPRFIVSIENENGTFSDRTLNAENFGSIVDGEWHHLTVVWNQNTQTFFRLGTPTDSTTYALSGSFNPVRYGTGETDDRDVVIGAIRRSGETGRTWNGFFDDVRVYNAALSEPDIKYVLRSYGLPPMCGEVLIGDLNGDCYVNLLDIAILAQNWLDCTDALNPLCD